MKTAFTPLEIVQFMQKKKDEIMGEEILYRATHRPQVDPYNPQEVSFSDGLNAVHQIGVAQGKIEGKVEIMNELIRFFEL